MNVHRCVKLFAACLVALAGAGCESELGHRELLCQSRDSLCALTDACRAALDASDCDALYEHADELAPDYRGCVMACPFQFGCVPLPPLVDELNRNCDCHADCIDAAPEAGREAIQAALECSYPPECRY